MMLSSLSVKSGHQMCASVINVCFGNEVEKMRWWCTASERKETERVDIELCALYRLICRLIHVLCCALQHT